VQIRILFDWKRTKILGCPWFSLWRWREEANAAFQNVTIINFNYDRIIEIYLFGRLQTQFGIEETEAAEIVSNLKIIRPYGKIGRLLWEDGNAVPFGADIEMEHQKLFSLSNNVRTYTEQNLSDMLRNEIKSAMNKARLVVFLGFGFHQQNMKILQASTSEGWRRILGTVSGIEAENYETSFKLPTLPGVNSCRRFNFFRGNPSSY
jgi:hypothetical protein